MAAVLKLEDYASKTETRTNNMVYLVTDNNVIQCARCEGFLTCEGAYLGCRACITMPELFVSQR